MCYSAAFVLPYLPGSVKWINVPNTDAEPLWSCEVRGALQCWCRPSQRNQTSESLNIHTCILFSCLFFPVILVSNLWSTALTLSIGLTETLLPHLSFPALETAAGWFKSFDQCYQRRLGGHQTHRARTEWQWTHERRHLKLSLPYLQSHPCSLFFSESVSSEVSCLSPRQANTVKWWHGLNIKLWLLFKEH